MGLRYCLGGAWATWPHKADRLDRFESVIGVQLAKSTPPPKKRRLIKSPHPVFRSTFLARSKTPSALALRLSLLNVQGGRSVERFSFAQIQAQHTQVHFGLAGGGINGHRQLIAQVELARSLRARF